MTLPFSQALGYISIACWLCAQLPQVLKNYRQSSCDGLSLPFLVTWLLGDVGNLVGCILTEQLPFQTYLATYFCLVDLSLLYQFFYYRAKSFTPALVPREGYLVTPRISQSLILPPTTSVSHLPHIQTTHISPGEGSRRPQRHVRTLTEPTFHILQDAQFTATPISEEHNAAVYAAALDVARAAKRASRTRSQSHRRAMTTVPVSHSTDRMMESFHSERSGQSTATLESPRMLESVPSLLDHRGRNMARTANSDLPAPMEESTILETRELPRDASRSLSLARDERTRGRRKAGVAFMALGLMLTMRQLRSTGGGMVIPDRSPSSSVAPESLLQLALLFYGNDTTLPPPRHHPPPQPSFQRIIGRLSAWACTTLYLSSRLPQIWKNFTRRSIEGLSILLFIFAFLGNTFYVLSILINPASTGGTDDANHYLLEALPYLLGSGGTLMFDLTIMIQAFIYGSSPPTDNTPYERSRRRTSRRKTWHLDEEGANGRRDLSSSVLSERQPLLANSTAPVTQRDRSLSPQVVLRQPAKTAPS